MHGHALLCVLDVFVMTLSFVLLFAAIVSARD